ncbi:unnamed protein product [Danaus chrysippus]|uniref:(African queen) hypothetical protein n=1 Tax=Danaus chrysippus TaxID=151541 RepID=A0A8J2R068_9NEOP|nr:unnamed protein product [Danaus chrysippus]
MQKLLNWLKKFIHTNQWERRDRGVWRARCLQSAADARRVRTCCCEVLCCVHVGMEEVHISDWPEPPGSHAWLPAYGFQHEIMEKDEYFVSNGEWLCSLNQRRPFVSRLREKNVCAS